MVWFFQPFFRYGVKRAFPFFREESQVVGTKGWSNRDCDRR